MRRWLRPDLREGVDRWFLDRHGNLVMDREWLKEMLAYPGAAEEFFGTIVAQAVAAHQDRKVM